MSRKFKKWLLCFLIVINISSFSQTTADTAGLVTEFGKVMSFATQPFLYCTTFATINSSPVLEEQDTLSYQGVYYKYLEDLYYNNGREELYLQDSFMIQINHTRKSIWISKVDMASKGRMDFLPVNSKQVQELFRKKYTITKSRLNGNASRFDLIARQSMYASTAVTTTMGLEFETESHSPLLMEIMMRMQQPVTDETFTFLVNENTENSKLLQTIDGINYLVRLQNIVVAFSDINNTKEAAGKMPSWKKILDFDDGVKEFIARELYKDYEVTKTF